MYCSSFALVEIDCSKQSKDYKLFKNIQVKYGVLYLAYIPKNNGHDFMLVTLKTPLKHQPIKLDDETIRFH